jgi:hypothetical protein
MVERRERIRSVQRLGEPYAMVNDPKWAKAYLRSGDAMVINACLMIEDCHSRIKRTFVPKVTFSGGGGGI